MGVPPVDLAPMTAEEFFAFTDTRPDDEKWELIDGEPILNAWPSRLHQLIARNITTHLHNHAMRHQPGWEVLPGLGVRVSDANLPVPDALVRPNTVPPGHPSGRECDDMIVAFEILSPTTKDRDLRWKRGAYLSLQSLTHYVVVAQDIVEVVVFGRDNEIPEHHFKRLDESLNFPALGVSLPLAVIYSGTGLGG